MINTMLDVARERKWIAVGAVIAIFSGIVAIMLSVLASDKKAVSEGQGQEAHVPEADVQPAERVRVPLHDWELSYRIPEQDEKHPLSGEDRIFGGIVPHHLAAQSFIAEMFSLLAHRENVPKTVVILSPNHAETGESFVQTANMVWETPDGFVGTDVSKSREIAESFKTPLQNEGMRNEHGVYTVIPFAKHFLPSANVVPITVRFATPARDQDRLVELLSKWLAQSDDVVVIASIDFSHYLSSKEAKRKDDETYAAMRRYDYAEIASYRSDHLDTPTGLIVLLRTMQLSGADQQTVLRYDNSGETLNQPFAKTTSHFLVTFTQKD